MRFTTMPCAIGSASANSSESPALAKPVALRVALALFALLMFAAEARAVMIQWSPVGDSGNAADTSVMITDGTTGYGAVDYAYSIGTYDVTNSQYVEFLNAKDASGADPLRLYDSNMGNSTYGGINYSAGNANGSKYSVISGEGNHPVNFVTWYDTVRFANWLGNGQGNGETETGAYTLLGGTPTPTNGLNITRNAGATVFLPSEDEWYKAAYYNPGTSSYFQYPTSSNMVPTASGPTALPNHANFSPGGPGNLTDVGAYSGTTSPYGAFDMGGNVWQWNEALITDSFRGLRSASYRDFLANLLSSLRTIDGGPTNESYSGGGFRMAMIPEPSTGMLALIAFGTLWWWRKLNNRIHRFASFFCASFVLLPLAASAAPITVPTGLTPGDQYRLAFVTSTARDATSSDIADYNVFVTTAANSVPALAALGTSWKAIGTTATVAARDNTGTNPAATGVPIYRLDGVRIADNNADLWDGGLQAGLSTDETGGQSSLDPYVWTGTGIDGAYFMTTLQLGTPTVHAGIDFATDVTWTVGAATDNDQSHHLYAMSGILTVPEPSTMVIAFLAAAGLAVPWLRRRRHCRP